MTENKRRRPEKSLLTE